MKFILCPETNLRTSIKYLRIFFIVLLAIVINDNDNDKHFTKPYRHDTSEARHIISPCSNGPTFAYNKRMTTEYVHYI
jgi:hypothetical protein